jgi:O-antigen ligase
MFIWTTAAQHEVFDRYAHDEYLQLAAEQGAVGLLGLGALTGGIVATLRRGRRSRTTGDIDLVALQAGAVAGLICFAAQSAFDFLWHVPVVPLIAAAAVGLGSMPPARAVMSQPNQQQEVPCSVESG